MIAASGVERLNALGNGEATMELLTCCGSRRWAAGMVASRPFSGLDQLLACADEIWWSLEPEDWLEAFRSHPRIGERKAAAGQTAREAEWSRVEQSGMDAAAVAVRHQLAEGNAEYEARFGHIYIVCAAGRPAVDLLALLRQRLGNDAATELRIAAEEQRKITRVRLEKLLLSS